MHQLCKIYCLLHLKAPHHDLYLPLLYLLFLDLGKQQTLHAIIFSVEYHFWTHMVASFENSM